MQGYLEVHRIDITTPQRIEYVVARQDPAILGPDARTIVTKIEARPGDVLVLYRSRLLSEEDSTQPAVPPAC